MLSQRTKLSLCLYLELHDPDFLRIFFQKHGLSSDSLLYVGSPYSRMDSLREALFGAGQEQLHGLLDEAIRTQDDLRYRVTPQYRHHQRWDDLVRCLQLDGYRVEGQSLVAVDPTIEAAPPIEDDLSAELRRAGLLEAEEILRLLDSSATAFRKVPPDYNACLGEARVALETLAKAIAKERSRTRPGSFDETRWGQVLAYLRVSGFVTEAEEKGLAGVYGFVSPGAHVPVGLTDEEMACLGRSLVASMCYFLVKRYNRGLSS